LDFVGKLLLSLVALAFAFTVHEAAHALVANMLGDPTARLQGRISLNPTVQLDPVGSVMLPVLIGVMTRGNGFMGWARPTPFEPRNFKHPRLYSLLVGLAGPTSNLLLGLLFALLAVPIDRALGREHALTRLIVIGAVLNAFLAVLNMIPVPPLDGASMINAVVRGSAARAWALIRPYGILILVAIMVIPALYLYMVQLPLALLRAFYDSVLMRVYGVPLPQTPDFL
jgi:Zn-dependent protease